MNRVHTLQESALRSTTTPNATPAEPRYRLGDRVAIAPGYWDKDLAGRQGLITNPPQAVTERDKTWAGRSWSQERSSQGKASHVYWVDVAGAEGAPSCAAEVREDHLQAAPAQRHV